MKSIGIVGGAGPMASSLLYKLIILECQRKLRCKDDADFPEIIVCSYPFSKMLMTEDSDNNSSKIAIELQSVVRKLKMAGADIIGMACNTLHLFSSSSNYGITDMIKETLDSVSDASKLLVLATPTTIKNRLYEKSVEIAYPCGFDQQVVNEIIARVQKGYILQEDSYRISMIGSNEIERSEVVLGCSELSVLNDYYPIKNVIDPLKVLAKKLVLSL
jgi:aspartate racemase